MHLTECSPLKQKRDTELQFCSVLQDLQGKIILFCGWVYFMFGDEFFRIDHNTSN